MTDDPSKLPAAERLFQLDAWVQKNRSWIMSEENPPLKAIRQKAESVLRFKCSPSNIKACMQRHEIPVRRSKAEAELIQLREANSQLLDLIIKIAAYTNLPLPIAQELHEQYDLNSDIVDALKLNRRVG